MAVFQPIVNTSFVFTCPFQGKYLLRKFIIYLKFVFLKHNKEDVFQKEDGFVRGIFGCSSTEFLFSKVKIRKYQDILLIAP